MGLPRCCNDIYTTTVCEGEYEVASFLVSIFGIMDRPQVVSDTQKLLIVNKISLILFRQLFRVHF